MNIKALQLLAGLGLTMLAGCASQPGYGTYQTTPYYYGQTYYQQPMMYNGPNHAYQQQYQNQNPYLDQQFTRNRHIPRILTGPPPQGIPQQYRQQFNNHHLLGNGRLLNGIR
jgi:hypothetical protein